MAVANTPTSNSKEPEAIFRRSGHSIEPAPNHHEDLTDHITGFVFSDSASDITGNFTIVIPVKGLEPRHAAVVARIWH